MRLLFAILSVFALSMPAAAAPLDWTVKQGEAAIERDGETGTMRVESHSDSEVVVRSSEIDVDADTVYRVDLRAARRPGTRLQLKAIELPGGRRHSLAPWPGYRPIPPTPTRLASWLATSPDTNRIRLQITLRRDTRIEMPATAPIGGELTLLDLTPHDTLVTATTPSANYVACGDFERSDDGEPIGFNPWGGTRVEPSIAENAGRTGDALRMTGRGYLLVAPDLPGLELRRYRFEFWAKGDGRVALRFRHNTDDNQVYAVGPEPAGYDLHTDRWTRCTLDATVLPGVDRTSTILQLFPADPKGILIDDVSVTMAGR